MLQVSVADVLQKGRFVPFAVPPWFQETLIVAAKPPPGLTVTSAKPRQSPFPGRDEHCWICTPAPATKSVPVTVMLVGLFGSNPVDGEATTASRPVFADAAGTPESPTTTAVSTTTATRPGVP